MNKTIKTRKKDFISNFNEKDLVKKSVHGGIYSIGAQGILFIITTVRTVILARILTPEDFGIIGMAQVILSFAGMFLTAGLGTAIIQQKKISHEQISSLFWINVLIGLGLTLMVFAISPFVGMFYDKEELTGVVAFLSVTFLIKSFFIQHSALLNRRMAFGKLAAINIGATIIGLVMTVLFALLGMNYWALVYGEVIGSIITVMLIFVACPWLPGKPRRNTGIKNMLRFGGNITAFNFINYFARNLDNILIGKFVGAAGLGFYSKAYNLFMLPINQIRNPINSVALPALSSLKEKKEKYARYYTRLVEILASATMPITIYCAIEAEFIISLILGPQWMACVPVFRILAVAGIIQPVYSTYGLVLLSNGKARKHLIMGTVNAFLTVIAFVAGLPFGIEGVATGYCVHNYIIFIPSLIVAFQNTSVSTSLFIKTITSPMLNALVAAGVVCLMKSRLLQDDIMVHIGILALYFAIYISLSLLRKSFRNVLDTVFQNIRGMNPLKNTA